MSLNTNLDKLVEDILRGNPETRDNDKLLVIKVWEYQGLKLTQEQKDFLLGKYVYNSESITRSRREIQARGLYRPTPKTDVQRDIFSNEYRQRYSWR